MIRAKLGTRPDFARIISKNPNFARIKARFRPDYNEGPGKEKYTSLVDPQDTTRLKIHRIYHDRPHGFKIRGVTEKKQVVDDGSPSADRFLYMDQKLHSEFLKYVLISISTEDAGLSFSPIAFTQKVEETLFQNIKRGRRGSLKRSYVQSPTPVQGLASEEFHVESCIVYQEEEVLTGANEGIGNEA